MERTLRELVLMAEGFNETHWGIASAIMSVVANCHITKKSKATTPNDFLPDSLRKKQARKNVFVVTKENAHEFRRDFLDVFNH